MNKVGITRRFFARPQQSQNVKLLYGAHRIGDYSYGAKRHRHDAILNEVLAALPRDTATIYDIGCGTGAYLRYFKSLGFERLTGVDLAPENIEPLLADGFRALEGNVLDLSNVPSGSADFTFSQGVIHHTPDPAKAFAELVRITKSGAPLYVNVYNAWNPWFYLIHRATSPLRWIYWNHTKRVADLVVPLVALVAQPISLMIMREFLDRKTLRDFVMDQVFTPYAFLFTKARLKTLAETNDCIVERIAFNRAFLMIQMLVTKR